MSIRQYVLVLGLALIGGVIGAVITNRFAYPIQNHGHGTLFPEVALKTTVLRVSEIELLDKAGAVQGQITGDKLVLRDGKSVFVASAKVGVGHMGDKASAALSIDGLEISDKTGRKIQVGVEEKSGAPAITLFDEKGSIRAVLGSTSLETKKTGSVTKTAPSSLTLFDKEGALIWQAP